MALSDTTPLSLGNGSEYDSIFTPLPAFNSMEYLRLKCRHMMEGVETLRSYGETYLPKKEMEKQTVYDKRLTAATLYNIFGKSVKGLTGRVFSKVLHISDLDEEQEKWFENIDWLGNNIDMFAKDVFTTAVAEGVSFILVDFPPVTGIETVTDEKGNKIPLRPYWVHLKPYEVIGWRFDTSNGPPILEHIRVRQIVEEPDGEYGVRNVERVRVYEPGICKEYKREYLANKPEVFFTEYKMGINSIPIVPVFTGRTGFFTATPPMYDLCMLNYRWYQSNSSQDHILDYARFPILFGKKIFTEDGSEVPIGPSNMIHSMNDGAALEYVEHTGAAIESGSKSLKELEDRMSALSNDPLLTKRTGTETATRASIDTAATSSELQAWALGLKDALELCLVFTNMWITPGSTVTETEPLGLVVMNLDYNLAIASSDYTDLLELRKNGEISRATLWTELSRRGLLHPDFNTTEEDKALNEEGAVKSSGDGLLSNLAGQGILPKELLFNELKRRGIIDEDMDWKDIQEMISREYAAPQGGNLLAAMLNQSQ